MKGSDRHAIAARLRGLIAGQDGGDIAVTAQRLGVEELSLRVSIDELAPYPTIDVITAVVAHYGIDPTFLLTGNYDANAHRRLLEQDNAVAAAAIRELADRHEARITPPPPPPSLPSPDGPHLHLA